MEEEDDGEILAKRPKLSYDSGGVDGGGGSEEDRLSALPEDLLIRILVNIRDAAVAARTSVLSSRWRRLWRQLPELSFPSPGDPHLIRLALQAHQAPALLRLEVTVLDGTPDSVAPWLLTAARRLSGHLSLINRVAQDGWEEDVVADERGDVPFPLPCFEDATSIHLELGSLGISIPPLGVFAGLTDLFLSCVQLHGPCMLGDVVSSPRCPLLQKLTVEKAWGVRANLAIQSDSLLSIKLKDLFPADALGLGHVTVESKSLLQMEMTSLYSLYQLTVMAPALKDLLMDFCFAKIYYVKASSHNPPVANIHAPRLKSLYWHDAYDPSSTRFGNIENLDWLGTYPFRVYGRVKNAPNTYILSILRRFEVNLNLRFMLLYPRNITNRQYLMEDMTRLPDITRLSLAITPQGHSFGASVCHVLRMSTGLRKLQLTIIGHPEVQPVCPSDCICDHPSNWKTKELALNLLGEVDIQELRGTEHEAALIKRLFDWATVLKKMTVTFHCSVNESEAKEFFQMLQSFSRPEICMKGPCFT